MLILTTSENGMSLKETLAVVTDCDWDDIARLSRDEAADKLLELLAAWEEVRCRPPA